MDPNKRAKILERELKAQEKFNKKYYREGAPEKKKRAFFVFWELIYENLGKFFMLNLFYGIVFAPVVLLGFITNIILTPNNEFNEYASLIPYMFLLVVILGILLGPVTAASTFIYRNLKTGKRISFFSDFFKQFKTNFKQSFIFGIFDAIIVATVLSLWTFFKGIMSIGAGLKTTILLCLIGFILFLYYSMRPYIYLQIVTIDLKVSQIVRNALFFAFLGVKSNILSLIFFAVMAGLGVLVIQIPWLLLIWLVCGFSLTGFIQVFCVYRVFHHHLIAPEEERAEKDAELDSISYEGTEKDENSENKKN